MQDVTGQVALWLAVAAEIAIWTFVIWFVIRHCVPWDELREKRALRRALAARVPQLRERVRRLAARTRHPPRTLRARWARELSDAMTRDAGRLLALVVTSIETIERNLRAYPREATEIERNVTGTLDAIAQILVLRDEKLPEAAVERERFARELLADIESLRLAVAERVEGYAAGGVQVAYERRCIALLANAVRAHETAVEHDPGAVFAVFPKWMARIRAVAESTELRAMVAKRLDEIAEELPVRAAHARQLFLRARPFTALLRADPRMARAGGRLAAIPSAGQVIESAENGLAASKVVAAEAGTDLGVRGESAKRLTEALLGAERALASLVILEEDLLVAVTIFDAGGGPRSN